MKSRFRFDKELLAEAMRHSSRKKVIMAALNEYIRYRKQLKITKFFGTIDYDSEYDYRKTRQLDRIEID